MVIILSRWAWVGTSTGQSHFTSTIGRNGCFPELCVLEIFDLPFFYVKILITQQWILVASGICFGVLAVYVGACPAYHGLGKLKYILLEDFSFDESFMSVN
ncbi:hypothetical protein KC19_11G033400 [Ceratodon purpureus]|uniref:Transmembrane protein n=1 Tax=Ceratodon purpureus TaxID=3225 RepID=A0A8T0GAU5_CERPU|nr:hypothetical protein KC19_11G033400 [Ceratodon purpureus]